MTQPPSPLTMLLSRHTRRRDFIAGLAGASGCGAVRGTSTLDQDRRRAVAAVRTRLLALALRSDLQETSNAGRMRSILEGLSRRDPAQVVIRREHPGVAGSLRAERGPGIQLQIS